MEPWVVGCVINLCGSVCINVGTNLVHYHHSKHRSINQSTIQSVNQSINEKEFDLQESAAPHAAQHKLDRSWYWYFGFLLFGVGNVSNFISMSFTAQSLLACLGSIQFVSNILCSNRLFNQSINRRICFATICIILGNALIVCFASHHSNSLTVDQLMDKYINNHAYQIYCAVMALLVLTLLVYYKSTKRRLNILDNEELDALQEQATESSDHSNHCDVEKCSNNQPLTDSSIDHSTHHFHRTRLIPFSYAAISAIIGTQSVNLAKASSELIRTSINHTNQFIYPFTYIIFIAYFFSMVFWLYRMNAALRKFEGIFIIPSMQVVWTLFSILGGGIFFGEFDFGVFEVFWFTLGVAIVLFGVYLLAPKQSHQSTSQSSHSSVDQSLDQLIHPIRKSSDADFVHIKSFDHAIDVSMCPDCAAEMTDELDDQSPIPSINRSINQLNGSPIPYSRCSSMYSSSSMNSCGHQYSCESPIRQSINQPILQSIKRSMMIDDSHTASTDDSESRASSCSNVELFDDWNIQADHSPLDSPTNSPITQPIDSPVGQPVDQSINQSVDSLLDQPSRPLFQSINQSAHHFNTHVIDLSSLSQNDRFHLPPPPVFAPSYNVSIPSINQSNNQSVSQSISESINQSSNDEDPADEPLLSASQRNAIAAAVRHSHHAMHHLQSTSQSINQSYSPLRQINRSINQSNSPYSSGVNTPRSHRARARGMSLGFSMPMFEAEDGTSD